MTKIASETAILLIEFQNDFCKPGFPLFPAVEKQIKENNTIENTVDVVKKAKDKGALILGIPITFDPDYKDLGDAVGIKENVKNVGAFKKGTEGAEFIEELKSHVDLFVEGKRGLCGFHGTNLDQILRYRNIKNVAIAGFLTNVCVESTARTAYDLNYGVTILKDCTAAMSREEQIHAEEKLFPLVSKVTTHDKFLEELE
ncbi:MAG: cysteine hydrolase [Candidatus Hermodarchaeota archaeon]